MKILSKDEILAADDLKREAVAVPEWGEDAGVYVSTVTADARDELEAAMFAPGVAPADRLKRFRARIASLTIVDAAGARLFSEAEVEQLGRKSARALQRVVRVAERLNGFSASEVEEIAKNSEPGPRAGSISS